ncbi:MAG: rRNA maturation RNase YbeY [Alphaproteobacteria bacterium]|jgi:probable rRNA maturation factor|nr:rRNA maturation RNase YbeY [Alphaproteobacteria bacterium]
MRLALDIRIDPGVRALAREAFPQARARARLIIRKALTLSGVALPEAVEIALLLTGDARIRDLNKTWRGKDAPTNVLSFPQIDWAGAEPPLLLPPLHLGDIAVSLPTIAREADALALPPQAHLDHMTAHGALHLLGYDHQTDEGAQRMEALEKQVLGEI